MSLNYKKIEIPDSLARAIRSRCLASVGQYDHGSHSFVRPRFDPSRGDLEWIQDKIEDYQIDSDEVKGIVNTVLQNTVSDAKERSLDKLPINGEGAIKPSQHFRIVEGGNKTDLLYLGGNEFYVVDTTRPTILPGDILIAKDTLVIGSIWHFGIIRNGVEFIDQEFVRHHTTACFITKSIDDIIEFQEPEIFQIIDTDDNFKRPLNKALFSKQGLLFVATKVQNDIKNINDDYFENNERYPNYIELLNLASNHGVSTYVLNLICQRVEKNETHHYVFVKADWEELITDKEKREREDKERLEKIKDQENLEKEFRYALETIKVKKVFLGLFEKDGQPFDPKEVETLITKLEAASADKALIGHRKIQTPRSDYQIALERCKRNRMRNAINAIIIAVIVGVIVFVAVTWIRTKANKATFDENLAQIENYMQQKEYALADSLLTVSKDEFRPSYMKPFIVSGTVKSTRKIIEKEIDTYVTETISQVTIMTKANRGRIDNHCWDLIRRAMELRPQNDTLIQFREKYIKQ